MSNAAFESLRESAEAALAKLRPLSTRLQTSGGNKDAQREINSEASRLLKDAERCLKSMENEARGAAPSQRRALQEAIGEVKAELSGVRAAIQRANDAASRADLLTKRDGGAAAAELEARDRMVAATESASRGTTKLQSAAALLSETQDVGIAVVDTMQAQRETLLRATDKSKDVNALTKTARTILRGIQARAITNKAILLAVIVVLLGCIGLIVYFGYLRHKSAAPSGGNTG